MGDLFVCLFVSTLWASYPLKDILVLYDLKNHIG